MTGEAVATVEAEAGVVLPEPVAAAATGVAHDAGASRSREYSASVELSSPSSPRDV